MKWSQEAKERMEKAPFFIRKIAKNKAEEMAKSRGKSIVELEDIELAKKSKDLEDVSKIDLSIAGITETKYKEIKPCGGLKGCPLTLFHDEQVIRLLHKVIGKEGLEKVIEDVHKGPLLYHHKFKAAISGCPNCCSQPQIRDLGIIGYAKPHVSKGYCISCNQCVKSCPEGLISVDVEPAIDYVKCIDCGRCIQSCPTDSIQAGEKGYRIIVGGRLGRRPHLAKHLIDIKSLEELEKMLTNLINLYKQWLSKGQKISLQVEKLGTAKIMEVISLGLHENDNN